MKKTKSSQHFGSLMITNLAQKVMSMKYYQV